MILSMVHKVENQWRTFYELNPGSVLSRQKSIGTATINRVATLNHTDVSIDSECKEQFTIEATHSLDLAIPQVGCIAKQIFSKEPYARPCD